jgi:hypothetical protein
MLERVTLTSYTQLSLFRRRIMTSPSDGALVLNLHVELPWKGSSWDVCFYGSHDLVSVLVVLSGLHSFELLGYPMLSSLLLSAHRSCVGSLTNIHLLVSAEDEDCISIITQFPNLTQLSICFSLGDPPFLMIEPLVLPVIQYLSLQWLNTMSFGFKRFILGSRFLNASVVTLIMPQMTDEDAFALAVFLRHSIGSTSWLSLRIPPSVASLPIFADVLSTCSQHIEFPDCVPLPSFVDSWRPGSSHAISVFSSMDGTELWSLLERLETIDPRGVADAVNIYVRLEDSRFTWRCGDESEAHARFAGKLMAVSLRLEEKGVLIRDEDHRRLAQPQP